MLIQPGVWAATRAILVSMEHTPMGAMMNQVAYAATWDQVSSEPRLLPRAMSGSVAL